MTENVKEPETDLEFVNSDKMADAPDEVAIVSDGNNQAAAVVADDTVADATPAENESAGFQFGSEPKAPAPDLTMMVCIRERDGSLGPPLRLDQIGAFQRWFEAEVWPYATGQRKAPPAPAPQQPNTKLASHLTNGTRHDGNGIGTEA